MQISRSRVVLAASVSAAVLALVLYHLDLGLLLSALREARPGWLAAATGLYTLSLLARGRQLSAVLDTTPRVATTSVGVQLLLTRVTPMRAGEITLPLLLQRHGRVGLTQALVAVVFVRLLEVTTIAGFLLVALLVEPASLRIRISTAAGLTILLVFITLFRRAVGTIGRLVGRVAALFAGVFSTAPRSPSQKRISDAAAAASTLPSFNRGLVLCLSVAIVSLETLLFGALLAALNRRASWVTLVRGSCAAVLGTALPIPSIGTIGTMEASWVMAFTWAGLDQDAALATGVAAQVFTLLLAALHALPCWALVVRGSSHGQAA
jgi:uncharacterized membrane protein YbhN (UPF0104 family)